MMEKIKLGWEVILSKLSLVSSLIFASAVPLLLLLVIVIAGYTISSFPSLYEIGNTLIVIGDKTISFVFNPIVLAPVKLVIIGIVIITSGILILDFFFPGLFEKKVLEKSFTDYVFYKLKGDYNKANEIERKIAEIQMSMMKSRMRYF